MPHTKDQNQQRLSMNPETNTLKMQDLKATPIEGQPLCYQTTSSDDEHEPHLQDLKGYEGNGYCTCRDFQCRCIPNIKEQQDKYQGRFFRRDYFLHFQTVIYKGDRKTHAILAKADPERTRCKHLMVALKDFTDRTLNQIAQDYGTDED